MGIIKAILPLEQRRMKIAMLTLFVNYILFALGIFKGVDFSDLGAGLALVNSPAITFLIGESIRPTGYTSIQTTTTSTSSETGDTKEIIANE